MNLKEKLQSLLTEDAKTVNNYFGSDFVDEYPDEDEDILDFLTENFFDIEMLLVDGKNIERPVKEALETAIKMIEKVERYI